MKVEQEVRTLTKARRKSSKYKDFLRLSDELACGLRPEKFVTVLGFSQPRSSSAIHNQPPIKSTLSQSSVSYRS